MMMIAQVATEGWGVTRRANGREVSNRSIKRIRERMRRRTPDLVGGMPHHLGRVMLLREWPELPWDDTLTSARIHFGELWDDVRHGERATVIMGNPIEVKKPTSKLRRWTSNDDFGHAMALVAANKDKGLVFDPLAPYPHRGAWVPKKHIRQFLWLRNGIVMWHWSIEPGSMTEREILRRRKQAQARRLKQEIKSRGIELAASEAEIDELVMKTRDLEDESAQRMKEIVALRRRIEESGAYPNPEAAREAFRAILTTASDGLDTLS
jgi:hypothetical protein